MVNPMPLDSERRSAAQRARRFDLIGKLSWLWMNSPLQRDWDMRTAARFLLPPLALGQYELIERDGMPMAYCSWAWMSAEAEAQYVVDSNVMGQLPTWKSGDRLWFVDWVAPFGAKDSWELRGRLARRFPDQVARAMRVKRHNQRARIMEFRGAQLDAQAAQERLDHYCESILSVLRADSRVSVERTRGSDLH